MGLLLLIGDGVHNFIGGLAIGAAFVADVRLGALAWAAAAMHEIPQELGDFGVLVHSGWPPRHALAANFVSALTFPLGGVVAWSSSSVVDVSFLLPFAAGNFLYIGAADLVPQFREGREGRPALSNVLWWAFGLGLLLLATPTAAEEEGIPLDQYFRGRVTAFEKGKVTILYDFSDRKQKEDWYESIPFKIRRRDGQGYGWNQE